LSITTSLQVFAVSLVFCTLTIKTYTTIGILPEADLSLVYDQAEDLGELWTCTKEILPYKEVSDDWIKEKFGNPDLKVFTNAQSLHEYWNTLDKTQGAYLMMSSGNFGGLDLVN